MPKTSLLGLDRLAAVKEKERRKDDDGDGDGDDDRVSKKLKAEDRKKAEEQRNYRFANF
jgi:hypothetical protein